MEYWERAALRKAVETFAATISDGEIGPRQVYDAGEAAKVVHNLELDLGTTFLLGAFLVHCAEAAAEAATAGE